MSVFSIPVTLGIDEENIAKEIAAEVSRQIKDKIAKQVDNIIFDRRGGYFNQDTPLRDMIQKEVKDIVKANEAVIVQKATELLAEKLVKNKAVKEAAAEAVKEALND